MVKANAYGHGAPWCVGVLSEAPRLYGFGVAALEEGREVRESVRGRFRGRIVVCSGAEPFTDEVGEYCEYYGLDPVIASVEGLDTFIRGGWQKRLGYHLKFNTGMNRMGMGLERLALVEKKLKTLDAESLPESVMTHFAMAEDAAHSVTRSQLAGVDELRAWVDRMPRKVLFHFANSASIWNERALEVVKRSDIARPGISLYGVPPWAGAKARGLEAVAKVQYRVLQIRQANPGAAIGYGATEVVRAREFPKGRDIAVIGAGYADGFLRAMSGRGKVFKGNTALRVLGRISMDLTVIEVAGGLKVSDWVDFLGPGIDPWTQSESAGTIPYELLTSLSNRVERLENEPQEGLLWKLKRKAKSD